MTSYFWTDEFDLSDIWDEDEPPRVFFNSMIDIWRERLRNSGISEEKWKERMDNYRNELRPMFSVFDQDRVTKNLFYFVNHAGFKIHENNHMFTCFGAYLSGIGFNKETANIYLNSIPDNMLSNYNFSKFKCPIKDWQDLRPIRVLSSSDIQYRKWSFNEYNKAYKYFFNCGHGMDHLTWCGNNYENQIIDVSDLMSVIEAFVCGIERSIRGNINTRVYVPPNPLPPLLYERDTPQILNIDDGNDIRLRMTGEDWSTRTLPQSDIGNTARTLEFTDPQWLPNDPSADIMALEGGSGKKSNSGKKKRNSGKKKSPINERVVSGKKASGKKSASKVLTKWHNHLKKISKKNKGVKNRGNFMQRASKTYKKQSYYSAEKISN